MKNLKRALSLVLSAAMMVGMMAVGTSAAKFSDVDSSDNLEAIELMAMIGVMEGTGDGEFEPDRIVTRNEMAVVICNLMKLKLNGFHNFTDVPEWADKYVAAMYTNGLTSGTSATTYGGSAQVTTTEAALMIMKTLGYFEYQGEFEDDWKLATIKKATELELFDKIDAGVNEGMTRGEVAQMVLNALGQEVVNAHEKGGMNVSGNGITVTTKPEYDYKTAYASLAEKLYDGTLNPDGIDAKNDGVSDANDAFGRPAVIWNYTGNGEDESITAADEAKLVITASKSAKDMKSLLKNYDLVANVDACIDGAGNTTTVYYKGADIDGDGEDEDYLEQFAALTGNGVTVEFYVDKNNDVTDVVVINEYLGEITKVNKGDEDTGDKRNVVVDYKSDFTFKTEDFAKKDKVVYTMADGVIKSMALAESVEGKITAIVAGKSLKLDGVTYKFGADYKLGKLSLGDTATIYLDSNGYLLSNGDVIEAAPVVDEYVVVIDLGKDAFGADQIKVLKADGTTEIVAFEEKDSLASVSENTVYTMEDSDGDNKFEFKNIQTDKKNDKYAGFDNFDKAGNYTAPDKFELNTKDDNLSNGWAIADDAVVFADKITVGGNKDKSDKHEWSVVTGAKLAAADGAAINFAYANKDNSGFYTAELLCVESAMSSASDVVYGYIVDDTATVKNADGKIVYSITLWNGEENVTLLADEGIKVEDATSAQLEKGDFISYKINGDGELTALNEQALTTGYISAFDGKKMTFGTDGTKYDVDDDTIILYVDVEEKAGVDAEDGAIQLADDYDVEIVENGVVTGTKTMYYNNVKYAVDADKDVLVLIVDVQNDIENKI